ncbi:UMP kinase [Coxiella burnetii]|uniref:Uridylate kinase n=2 Tax=Coxiella burnetii TaxID=777 RepID=PYRH_COXBU|nr:UMP kinase [Coxiella burnetii]NP_820373.1 uridylate kinase [Coxiella burnetii RSA 493]Q83BV3.1 RecName: Full=Uridylate kinase; Short=UK; AltName: Full=Uridine monophosphate kinase; Short=UMP kinase; Short=UMPK [Coxiella burnetii RSA 493]AAO90887.1 uridylate kinase [Coxiella burnetii RSA 493]ABS77151.1 uridylate kinase [Coxiella burnetii Dugway 5J108-111]ABX78029.1 uridylate kinase [Coxiella burnetii RSA 331]ACJ18036.1 uridylate kinase [Coxiella burnetii CbuG_Q212]AML49632.1 UMP kinase [Co
MTNGPQPLYRRVLLKMSGEALMGKGLHAIDPNVLDRMAKDVTQVYQLGVQIAIVIGGGNFFRGAALQAAGINRITGDYMGMLATLMNALALRDAFERSNLPVRILSAIPMTGVADAFHRRKAIHHLQQGRVVIFAAGTGNPLVTTDSAASLRGIEINADVVLKATNVDGVYSDDPAKNPQAKLYKHLSYQEALKKELAVMDLAAFCQCRDYNMPLRVFNINKPGALLSVIMNQEEGTLVDQGQ